MSNPESIAFDLSKASQELGKRSKFKELSNLINRRHAVMSTNQDLKMAWDMLLIASDFASMAPAPTDGEIIQQPSHGYTIGSLLNNAIFKYTSAMHSDSIKSFRWKTGFAKNDPVIRAAHKRVCNIRDNVLAHYGEISDHLNRPWNMDAMIIQLDDTGMRTRYVWERTNYLQAVFDDVRMLIENALAHTQARIDDEAESFQAQICDAMKDSDFAGILSKYPFVVSQRLHNRSGDVADFQDGMEIKLHKAEPAYKITK
ncbi:MAG: hypothetical protein V4533_09850 [Pseudomonadota bacterium]|jgi:hypothetical protein